MTLLRALVRYAQEGSLYALLLLLPFSKAAVEVLFGVLLLTWLFARLDPETRGETLWRGTSLRPLAWALAGYLAVCALSIAVSHAPALSFRGWYSKWLEYLLLFVIVTDVASRPRVVKRSLRVLTYAAGAVFLEAISQERYGRGFFMRHRLDFYGRMTGPYENPIDLATLLMVLIPILLGYAAIRRRGTRWSVWGVLFLLAISLARTEAVGAWLGLGVGLMVLALGGRTLRRAALAVVVLGMLAAGFFLVTSGRLKEPSWLADIGAWDRWVVWQAAIRMIMDRPVLGHGLNTFMSLYLDYWVGGERAPRYAHNCFLQVAAETGLVGLLLFVGLLWLMCRRWIVSVRHLPARDGLLLWGLLAGLLAFIAQSAVDTNFYALRQAALFWTLSGLATGLATAAPSTRGGLLSAAARPISTAGRPS